MPSLPFDESNTFSPPPAFGPHRVLHQIGSGVLGPVFRTYDPETDRLVAVKAFRLDLLPEDVVRLADGVRKLVGHVGNLAAGLEGTTAYLAMDYYAAETLDVSMRHLAPATLDVALPLLRGIAESIDRAWRAGAAFGHGTLHPRDVFVTPGTTEVTVTGFGIAPALEAIGVRPPVRRPYTSPERAAGSPWDIRADVFSLGAIAHELLTGRRPAGPGEQDGSLPASWAPELRVQIRRVLSKALAESPSRRFVSAQDLIDALADPSSLAETHVASALPLLDAAPERIAADPLAAAAAPVESVPPVVSAEPTEVVPTIAIPRPRPRAAVPATRTPTRMVEPLIPFDESPNSDDDGVDEVERAAHPATDTAARVGTPSIDDVPLRPVDDAREKPSRTMSVAPPLPLPPPVPWGPMAAVAVACLILGAVIDHQFFVPRTGTLTAVSAPVASPNLATATPTSPATTDTEVAVLDPAPTRSGEVDAGRVLVRSTPSGAAVAIDGHSVGQTPVTTKNLALGAHSVAISRPGSVTDTRRLTLTAEAPSSTIDVTLKADRIERAAPAPKAATTGSVNVDSRPKGARVTIDGRASGVTPLGAAGLKPGVHTVRVEFAGYKPVTTTVTVKAGETARLAVTLEQR